MSKSRRPLLIFILLALILAGGGYAAFKFWKSGAPWPETALKNLVSLEFSTPGQPPFTLYKQDERWMARTEEGHCRGSEARIRQFGEALSVIGAAKTALPDGYSVVGRPVLASLHLATEKQAWKLEILSDPERGDSKVPVRVSNDDGESYTLVDARFLKLLEMPVTEYSDLRLFDLKPERINRLVINVQGVDAWDLSRVHDGVFQFLQPQRLQHVELAQAAIEFYLYAVTSMHSPRFLQSRENLEGSLPEALLEVQIWSDDLPEPEELIIYHQLNTPEFGPFVAYSSRQDGYLPVPAAKVQQLSNSLLSLRNHPILPQGIGLVDRVMLTTWNDKGLPRQYVFVRENEEWRRQGAEDTLVGMDALIWRLGTMQTDGNNGNSSPQNPVRLMRWDFFSQGSTVPTLVLSFSNEQDMDGIKSWVQVGPDGPWFPLQSQVVTEILGHLPAPLEN